ncbi:hypothetical protein Leryth_020465 [Lithospermum erythrorhizon]|nr:hypothetical protein Leryth_020465 [Lithospermum erythrorhizon]
MNTSVLHLLLNISKLLLIFDEIVIQSIVNRVLREVVNVPIVVAPYLVGLDSQFEKLMDVLNVSSHNGVKVLRIHGIGGVGKTTLAKALYNKLAKHFEYRGFILNVREMYAKHGDAVHLQNKLISSLSSGSSPVNNEHFGMRAIRRLFQENRVLLVLDDVESPEQLRPLVIELDSISEGSRVIITTRNSRPFDMDSDIKVKVYELRELDKSNSRRLFSYYAFRRENPTQNLVNLSNEIVRLTGGLPLALEVFGSFLFDKNEDQWPDALEKLKTNPPDKLQLVLRTSYDALDIEEKCVFLDISCLFLNLEIKKEYVIDVLRGCEFRGETAIATLVSRSLLKVTVEDTLTMHDQIRDMGRQIVKEMSFPSRLWDSEVVIRVLLGMKGSPKTEGISLDLDRKGVSRFKSAKDAALDKLKTTPTLTYLSTYIKEVYGKYIQNGVNVYGKYIQNGVNEKGEMVLNTALIKPMVNLRLLQFSKVTLQGNLQELPSTLKWLQLRHCNLDHLAFDFCPEELGVLDLSESNIKKLWGWKWNWNRPKVKSKLKVLNLHGCYNIVETPDLSLHHSLDKLIFERCSSLERVHQSITDLASLRHLNFRDCENLSNLPSDISGLKNLEVLILSGCKRLKDLPESMGRLTSLRELFLGETNIDRLPETIFRLVKLEKLDLARCEMLKQLPRNIGKLSSLREMSLYSSSLDYIPETIGSLANLEILNLMWCESLTVIPDTIGNIKSLREFFLDSSSIRILPESIGSLHNLCELSIGNCSGMSSFPSTIEGLSNLIELQLSNTLITKLPDQLQWLKSVRKLEMRNCTNLNFLPESLGDMSSLERLIITNASITYLPESTGKLENLIMLRLTKCKKLIKLPKSFGDLKSLHHLYIDETAVTRLPESFGMLSSLMVLRMAKKPYDRVHQIPGTDDSDADMESRVLPTSFSNLSSLQEFDARAWKIPEDIRDDFEKLSALESLSLGHNDFHKLPSSLRGLSLLKKLILPHCKNLRYIPALPSSLIEVNAANCGELQDIYDVSNLEYLEELNLTNCRKLRNVLGLESLKSLRRLHMSGCDRCAPVLQGFSKDAVKKLHNLSIPGNKIPDWFPKETVCFSARRNNKLKSIVVGVVVSVDSGIPDSLRDELPVIPDVYAEIIRVDKPIFRSALNLQGVPKSNENQLYLCRFEDYHPLVSILEDGDEIVVARREPPFMQGIELIESGMRLVFEHDDDYDGDEESLDEREQTQSERLRKFIASQWRNQVG